MSQRYLGGVITANPTTPTTASASGVWTLEQQFQYLQGVSPRTIGNSVRLRSSASAYLNRTPAIASNYKTSTLSFWVKRGSLSARQALFSWSGVSTANNHSIEFYSDNTLQFYSVGTAAAVGVYTTQVFRDPSAWYHLVYAIDTTQATASDRIKLYVNGVQVTAFSTASYPAQNADLQFNSTNPINIGRRVDNTGAGFFDGYIAEVNWIDGQALAASSFGAFDGNGVWQPLPYTGTYGTNGFYLTFADNSAATATTLGKDYSGNGNNWTPNNISVTAGVTYDWMLDSPSNYADGGDGRGNYATLNPLDSYSSITISNANLNLSVSTDDAHVLGTIGMTSGKWYWEYGATSGTYGAGGVAISSTNKSTFTGGDAGSWGYAWNGSKYNAGTGTAYGATLGAGDIIGVAFDADVGTLTFYKNGTSQGTAFTGLTNGPYFPAVGDYTMVGFINFGQRPFAYTPPTGFVALNTQNLPAVNINNGAQYMAATTYSGNSGVQTINNGANTTIGTAFQPDFVWVKSRTNPAQGYFNNLNDSVRGTSSGFYKTLYSNTTEAEDTYPGSTYGGVSAITSTGFTVSNSGSNYVLNQSTYNYVAWQWKAGGTAVSNTNGSITSSVSANTAAGFSVVTYTGTGANATVGHGLGVAPAMVIVKNRSAGSTGWIVYQKNAAASPATGGLRLNLTDAFVTYSLYWNNTAPTSSVFTVSTDNQVNGNGNNMAAYCFAEVAGYSKFGSYTGNGSTDGPFVYCGFRPRWVMWKRTDAGADGWFVFDTSRDTINVAGKYLLPAASSAEQTLSALDILSNGFKLRGTATGFNTSGGTYIYAAFAENPFNIARAR